MFFWASQAIFKQTFPDSEAAFQSSVGNCFYVLEAPVYWKGNAHYETTGDHDHDTYTSTRPRSGSKDYDDFQHH